MAVVLGACVASTGQEPEPSAADSSTTQQPQQPTAAAPNTLVGKWHWAGRLPATVDLTLSLHADKRFEFEVSIGPATGGPAGIKRDLGCDGKSFGQGTYADSVIDGAGMLSWTFSNGTADLVTGCDDAANNREGSSLTAGMVDGYIDRGYLPPMSLIYSVDAMTLAIASRDGGRMVGVARGGGTEFTRVP